MRRLLSASLPTLCLLVLITLWLAPQAHSDGQQGGLPRLSQEVDFLSRQVLSLVGRAPDCPCYDRSALLALEPTVCEHQTRTLSGSAVGSVLTAGPFGGDALFGAQAEATVTGFDGSCFGPLGSQDLPYEQGKRCARLMEETLGPCAEVEVEILP